MHYTMPLIIACIVIIILAMPNKKCCANNTPTATQPTNLCPSTFIANYTNTVYHTVLQTTARLFHDLNQFTAQPTEFFVSRQELIAILNTASGAITCAMPRYMGDTPKLSDAEIATLEQTMEYYFNCRGLKFIRADGYYDGYHVPNSYIVLGLDEAEMILLAHSFAQYSLLTFNQGTAKILHLQGRYKDQCVVSKGWTETPLANDNYTAVPTTDGLFKFTYNFDLNSLEK